MKKRVLSLALCATALLGTQALTSCGGSSVDGAGENFEVLDLDILKEGTTEVEFWQSFGQNIEDDLLPLVDKFEADMQAQGYNIKINVTNKGGGYDGLRSSVNMGISSNAVPTMVLGYPDHFADYIDSGILLPLDEYVYSENEAIALEGVTKESNDFIPSYWAENQMVINGEKKVAGIPFNKSTEVMYYNASMVDPILEELGYLDENDTWQNPTWDEVFAVSQYIIDNKSTLSYVHNSATYKVGDKMTYPVFVDSEANFFITTSRQWAGEGYYTTVDSNGKGIVTAYNDSNKSAQEYFLAKAKAKLFQFPKKESQSYGSKLMLNRNAFISIGSTAGVKNNAHVSYELKVTSIPQKDDQHKSVIQQGTNLAILTPNSNNKTRLAAWMLIKYLTNAQNNEAFSTATGYLPVRQSILESDTFKAFCAAEDDPFAENVPKAINAAFAQKDYFYTDPAFSGSSLVRDKIGTAILDMYIYDKSYDKAMGSFYSELEMLGIKTQK